MKATSRKTKLSAAYSWSGVIQKTNRWKSHMGAGNLIWEKQDGLFIQSAIINIQKKSQTK